MTTERHDLLRYILEHPDDDAPRLVFADWLDERGDADSAARAEFIRLQCRLAGTEPDYDARTDHWLRQGELLRENRQSWVEEDVPAWLDRSHMRLVRGFAAEVRCSTGTFTRLAERIAAETLVQHVRLSNWSPTAASQFAECPHLGRIRELAALMLDTPEGVRAVLDARSLVDVRCLRLEASVNTDLSHLSFALGRPAFRRLRRLELSSGESGVFPVAGASPPELRELQLDVGAQRPAEVVTALLAWPPLAQLTSLSLTNLGAATLTLLASADFSGLREFRLDTAGWVGIAESARELFSRPAPQSLAVLGIPGQALTALVDSPWADGLRELSLWSSSPRGLTDLTDSPRFGQLRRLRLSGAYDMTLRLLADSPHFPQLRRLDIASTNDVTSGGLADLDARPGLPRLNTVTLGLPDRGDGVELAAARVRHGFRFTVLEP